MKYVIWIRYKGKRFYRSANGSWTEQPHPLNLGAAKELQSLGDLGNYDEHMHVYHLGDNTLPEELSVKLTTY